ncbi:hypothetical protein LZ198_35210 [Myxococcus sp. K15C18031901]|uniref:hypothetical protein n=1 Tax=Myxococcus dinghuensis TaxID=2906761 RepID=UPI0020A741BF|nr:hypothetical protein [Myxococcus dinghuensis]MCP3104132.1 hypothetical protein [Myxococcus dinghuensis]
MVNAPQPPLRLALDSDTLERVAEKNREVNRELAAWRALSLSTDGFEDTQGAQA